MMNKKELISLIKILELGDIVEFENIGGKSFAKFQKDKTLILKDGKSVPHTHILTFLQYVSRPYNNGKPRYILVKKQECF